MTLDHYLKKWNLAKATHLTSTTTSLIYKVSKNGSDAILKLLSEEGRRDEAAGAEALTVFAGVGAVELLEADDGAHLLEYVEGKSLLDLVDAGEDQRALAVIIETIEKLHSQDRYIDKENFTDLKKRFRSLFNPDLANGRLFQKARNVAEHLLSNPKNSGLLHGDIHHENILESSIRGWLAIDPKGLYGEKTYDYANTLMNPNCREELVQDRARLLRRIDTIIKKTTLERSRLLAFFFCHSCLSAVWSIEAAENPNHALKMAGLIERDVQ